MTRTQKHRLVFLLAFAWVLAIFAPLAFKDFRPPPEIHGSIPAVIGALLAIPTKRGEDEPDGRSRDSEDGEQP